jgi:hypothetical protein
VLIKMNLKKLAEDVSTLTAAELGSFRGSASSIFVFYSNNWSRMIIRPDYMFILTAAFRAYSA